MEMRKIRKSRREDVDQIIIEALQAGSKTPDELKKVVIDDKDVTESTYYRHVDKLVKQGIIKPPKFELAEGISVEEADEKEVLQHLEVLNKEENPEVLQFRIGRLSHIAGPKRIAHIPNILNFCEDALQNPKYQDKGVLKELVILLKKILHFERFRKPPNYEQIVKRLSATTLQSLLKIMEKETDFGVLSEIIEFLWATDKEDAVRGLFEMVKRIDDQLYEKLKEPRIFEALFRTSFPLHRAQNKYIDRNIDNLLKSTIQRDRERGKELAYEKTRGGHNY